MPKKISFSDMLAVLLIFFAQTCNALDFRTSNILNMVYICNNTMMNRPNPVFNVSTKEYVSTPVVRRSSGKKWQVGRVSRKQYEIINMLWRKTNIFGDEERTAPEPSYTDVPKKILVDSLTPIPETLSQIVNEIPPNTHSSTISYIEFYYLDETGDPTTIKPEIKSIQNSIPEKNMAFGRLAQLKNFVSRSPLFAFRLNEPSYKLMPNKEQFAVIYDKFQSDHISKSDKNLPEKKIKATSNNDILPRFLAKYIEPRNVRTSSHIKYTTTTSTHAATPNDRVKFFEVYDSNTQKPVHKYITNSVKENEINDEKRLALEQVDKDVGHGPNKIRYAKKHVIGRDMEDDLTQFFKSLIKINKRDDTLPVKTTRTSSAAPTTTHNLDDFFNYTMNEVKSSVWSKYPFAAVFVYERYQVHCDAAAISPYWLIASAACISRHHEDSESQDRSAFIAYCGESWWYPERIAYVKYTLVHPRYHPKDTVRRHLYNIGLIQVASSMASSCPGWAPVNIISHQYITEITGSEGAAVGWGLNRYDTSYESRDLPRHRLSVYKSYIYSNSCPGNSGYRNTKRLNDQSVSNVYCMTLPPYTGEDSDPVHGGLLLVGGKLIALYLQEERRRWGDQSAQYTGIWRLVPWVLDVAKDPDEMDFSLMR